MDPPSETDTIADEATFTATWNHWPTATKSENNLARLVPLNRLARNAFRSVIADLVADPPCLIDKYATKFVHWEFCVDSDNETDDETDTKRIPVLEPVSGFYRLTSHLRDDRWTFGCGIKNRRVELILDTPSNRNAVHSRHGKIIYAGGYFTMVADRIEIMVDNKLLRHRPTVQDTLEYKKVLTNGSIITIGSLIYRFDILLDTNTEVRTKRRESEGTVEPLFTPTPGVQADLMMIGGYTCTAIFASGTYGQVYGATKSGREYVIKRTIVYRTRTQSIKNEIALLRKCNHANIVRLVEHIYPQPFKIPGRSSSKREEHILVLEPAMQKGVNDLSTELATLTLPARISVVRDMLGQLLPAIRYLHDQQGIMHRDIKHANLAFDDRGPRKFIIIDFGSAVFGTVSRDTSIGTLAYFAPEMYAIKDYQGTADSGASDPEAPAAYGHKVDVYALGLVSAQLILNAALPDDDRQNVVFRERLASYKELETSDHDLGLALGMMLCEDPYDRPTAAELLVDLGLASELSTSTNR